MRQKGGELPDVNVMAGTFDAQVRALPVQNAENVRAVRREYSRRLKAANPGYMLDLVLELVHDYGYRGPAYELLRYHRPAFSSLGETELEALGKGIDSWWSVDGFARTLSGPAWLRRQVSDDTIDKWACSGDFWWRRAALVSTVALNIRSHGGLGDTARTLAVCRLLVADHEDMVVKAMSWALRELVVHDPDAVRAFLEAYDDVLAARVKREVTNKLETGLKNPRRSAT
jgi:3-methyladenine DNA glycosylase AlkD